MTFASHSSLVSAINERYLFNVPGVKEIWLIRHADAYYNESSWLAVGQAPDADAPD